MCGIPGFDYALFCMSVAHFRTRLKGNGFEYEDECSSASNEAYSNRAQRGKGVRSAGRVVDLLQFLVFKHN